MASIATGYRATILPSHMLTVDYLAGNDVVLGCRNNACQT
jgi:hypothetical protein